jgi:hypothetical protein
VSLLDVPLLEQQLLGLVWRGAKIDHPNGEHDDFATAAVGALLLARELSQGDPARYEMTDEEARQAHAAWGFLADEYPEESGEPIWMDDPQDNSWRW